ncbi:MAG: transcription repressor NadR [Pelosinus sp.]|nr:transcription repressor NadR [Pelosinus sp.]
MDAKARRDFLLEKLKRDTKPVTGAVFAKELGVSRQIIVGDIAILRAAGIDIFATPQGYVLPNHAYQEALRYKIACRHNNEGMEKELAIVIDNGGKVLDVIVEHPIYGEICANLMLASRRDLKEFMERITNSEPLSLLTGGVHLHTIEVPSNEIFNNIELQLRTAGILMK